MSVSPKTRVESLPGSNQTNLESPHAYTNEKQTSLKRKASDISYPHLNASEEQGRPKIRRQSSMTIDGLLNEAPAGHRNSKIHEAVFSPSRSSSTAVESPSNLDRTPVILEEDELDSQQTSPTKPLPANRRNNSTTPSFHSPVSSGPRQPDYEQGVNNSARNTQLDMQADRPASDLQSHIAKTASRRLMEQDSVASSAAPPLNNNSSVPIMNPTSAIQAQHTLPTPNEEEVQSKPIGRKPPRMETPIFAQSYRKWKRAGGGHQGPHQITAFNAQVNGHDIQSKQRQSSSNAVAGTTMPPSQPNGIKYGQLGPWEPSILNLIPTEEVVKVVSDFLFGQVVLREGIGVGPAGGKTNEGAVLEIEAKIGRLIDRNTNDRLRLPVLTECVVSQCDPDIRINFESQMTEVSEGPD